MLWRLAFIQFEFPVQLLAQMAATAFSKDGVFSLQFITGFKRAFLIPVLVTPHITGSNTDDSPGLVIKYFRRTETGKKPARRDFQPVRPASDTGWPGWRHNCPCCAGQQGSESWGA